MAELRQDLALVAEQVQKGSRVLDLGCGTGSLLSFLQQEKGCSVTGVEIDPEKVLGAIRRGVPVIEWDVEAVTPAFSDKSYDVAVLSRTLQSMLNPEQVLREMSRIANRLIVSMPNFGYYPNRIRLLLGRMPRSPELPYAWYDSPNLRFTTLVELERLFEKLNLRVEHRFTYTQQGKQLRMYASWANLVAGAAVYVLSPMT